MSKTAETKQVTISLDELAARAELLRRYIELLKTQMDLLLEEINELKTAYNTLKEARESEDEIYISTNRFNTVLIKGSLPKGWDKDILLHIGLEYFIKTDKETAMKLLEKKISEREEVVRKTREDYKKMLIEYEQIQGILATVYQQLQAGRAQAVRQGRTGAGK